MSARIYRSIPELKIADYGEESIVFNGLTWQTHLLNPAAAHILTLCAQDGCTAEQVAEHLCSCLRPDETHEAQTHAQRTLETLEALNLVSAR